MDTSPTEGSSVGRFRLIRQLAIGGFSDVWEATDANGTRVAVKIGGRGGSASGTTMFGRHNARGYWQNTGGGPFAHTFSPEDVVRLFAAEVTRLRAAAGRRMPLLVDHGVHDGVPYLAMELLEHPWDLASAAPQDFVNLLWALHELTGTDVSSHGDLKPEHVFRRADGSFVFVDPGFYDWQTGFTRTPAYDPWRTGVPWRHAAGDVVAVALMAWLRYAGKLPMASWQAGGYGVPDPPPPLGSVAAAPQGIAQWIDSVLRSAAENPARSRCAGIHDGRREPTWMRWHAAAAEQLTALATHTRSVGPERLPPRTRSGVSAVVPAGWVVKESWTLQPGDGVGNIVLSSEPLDDSVDSMLYAAVRGEMLRNHMADFVELAFVPHTFASGEQGYLRDFLWTAPHGRSIKQLQIYFAEDCRGFCATATIPEDIAESSLSQLRSVFESVRVERG